MCTEAIYHNSLGKFMDLEEFKHCSSCEAIRNKQMHVLRQTLFRVKPFFWTSQNSCTVPGGRLCRYDT